MTTPTVPRKDEEGAMSAAGVSDTTSETRGRGVLRALRDPLLWSRNAVYLGLVIVWLIFFIMTPNFLTPANLTAVLVSATVPIVLAVGQTFVIVVGGIDLTIGSNVQWSGILFGILITGLGVNLGLAIPLAVLAGFAAGAFFGALIAVFRINDFVVTLGGLSLLSGAGLLLSGGQPLSVPSRELLLLATGGWGPFKYFTIIAIFVVVVGHILMFHTRLGGHIRATGGNELAARESGVSTVRVRIAAYAICGTAAGLGAVLMVARTGAADPNVGTSLLLQSIAAVVLGGASLTGGRGSIVGAAVGALLLTSLLNGFTLLAVSPFIQPVAVGVVVIGAALLKSRVR